LQLRGTAGQLAEKGERKHLSAAQAALILRTFMARLKAVPFQDGLFHPGLLEKISEVSKGIPQRLKPK